MHPELETEFLQSSSTPERRPNSAHVRMSVTQSEAANSRRLVRMTIAVMSRPRETTPRMHNCHRYRE